MEINRRPRRCSPASDSNHGLDREEAWKDHRSPLRRPNAARGRRMSSSALSLGNRTLGYESWYIEDSGANPFDPRANSVMMGCDYNVAYLRRIMEHYGFGGRWAYWDAIQNVCHGAVLQPYALALQRGCGRDQPLRCDKITRGASRLSRPHHDRYRSRLRAD